MLNIQEKIAINSGSSQNSNITLTLIYIFLLFIHIHIYYKILFYFTSGNTSDRHVGDLEES